MATPALTHPPLREPHAAFEPCVAQGCEQLIQRLNDSLATELACVLYYNQRPPSASGLASLRDAQMPLPNALRDLQHVDRLARHVVHLGGMPAYPTDPIDGPLHAAYDRGLDLGALIKANLAAEHAVMEACQHLLACTGNGPAALHGLLQALITGEQAHMDKLTSWFDD